MSDEPQTVDPLAQAQDKPKAYKAPAPKRGPGRPLKEVRPAEDPTLDAGADEIDGIDAPEEHLPDGPGDYRVSLKNCAEKLIRSATGRDHAIRTFMRFYGIIRTENDFTVTKVA